MSVLKKCIYCRETGNDRFKGVEHVMPESFGTFGSQTPTLNCVCDECNAYFGKELDQLLARDTLEGVFRYKKGIFSSESRRQTGIKFYLGAGDETGEYGGIIIEGVDGKTGKLLGPIAQAHFLNTQTNKYEAVPIQKIAGLDWRKLQYSDKGIKVFGRNEAQYNEVVQELKKIGINYQAKTWFGPPPFLKRKEEKTKLPVTLEGTIDKKRKRALVKILFNFATYYLGEEEVFKRAWDKTREFVRFDGQDILGRATNKPFWNGQETEKLRFADDSYNMRIENQIINGSNCVVGVIQIYNLFTYEFVLSENYSLPENKEVAFRFTPGKKPHLGEKRTKPNWGS